MKIREFYHDEDSRLIYIEFSTKEDNNDYYRIIELDYNDVILFSPTIIDEHKIKKLKKGDITDVLIEYFKDNDLPPKEIL